jgi:hypothetical protein
MPENNWAQAIRDQIKKAEYDTTPEGRADIALDQLPQQVYRAKKSREKRVVICSLWKWNGEKTLNDLVGSDRIIVQKLMAEGFSPFIHYNYDDMDGGRYCLCLPV